jgi:copper chaperone CopZ
MDKELTIGGMHCHHCIHAVRRALSTLENVEVLDVQIGRARVRVKDRELDEARVREALDEEGYSLEKVG